MPDVKIGQKLDGIKVDPRSLGNSFTFHACQLSALFCVSFFFYFVSPQEHEYAYFVVLCRVNDYFRSYPCMGRWPSWVS